MLTSHPKFVACLDDFEDDFLGRVQDYRIHVSQRRLSSKRVGQNNVGEITAKVDFYIRIANISLVNKPFPELRPLLKSDMSGYRNAQVPKRAPLVVMNVFFKGFLPA